MNALRIFLPLLLSILLFDAHGQGLEPTSEKALMKVKVINMDKGPQEGQKVTLTGLNSGKEFSRTTGNDGTFEILLPKGDVYRASYTVLGKTRSSKKVKIPDQSGKFSASIKLMFQMPQKITLKDVHFNTGESTLRASSYETLGDLVKVLEQNEGMKVMIAGHTDSRGDKASNKKLSEERAKAVVDYLVKQGIDRSRLKAKGFGESQPIASNETAEGRQKNRRTEVRVLER